VNDCILVRIMRRCAGNASARAGSREGHACRGRHEHKRLRVFLPVGFPLGDEVAAHLHLADRRPSAQAWQVRNQAREQGTEGVQKYQHAAPGGGVAVKAGHVVLNLLERQGLPVQDAPRAQCTPCTDAKRRVHAAGFRQTRSFSTMACAP
jgi:hypothetical protein